ncbi:MAG: hypothetical protein ACFFKA_13830, partial [Candidatus Thorarchaeota archaeon]
ASKGFKVIPFDMLSNGHNKSYDNMYWYSGNQLLPIARYVSEHPQLFGVFITNFSCGPDSFIIPYFRRIMGTKPSITLELDSHSADVGIDTRIDAAIDIIRNYIELRKKNLVTNKSYKKSHLEVINTNNNILIVDKRGKEYSITSKEVEVIIPSMGRFSTDAFSAVFRSLGIKSKPLPVPTEETLKIGRSITTCKECLPFILTSGSLLEYIKNKESDNNKTLFFMPHGYGPCRQGQYFVRLRDIIDDLNLRNVGIITMDDESSFSDFGEDFFKKQWIALMISDVIHDIENTIKVLAKDKTESMNILETEWSKIIQIIEKGNFDKVFEQLNISAKVLSRINLSTSYKNTKTISLIGEIYVRREEFSRNELIKTLIQNGFIIKTAPITEYVYYTNYLQKQNILGGMDLRNRIKLTVKDKLQIYYENKVKKILSKSGLIGQDKIRIENTLKYAKNIMTDKLIGESILTVGLALREILDESCGVVSIGPFNCIPSRLAEAILTKEMSLEGKYNYGKIKRNGYPENLSDLPYLHIESDGNLFPQITQSRIEIFMLQANRLHEEIVKTKH